MEPVIACVLIAIVLCWVVGHAGHATPRGRWTMRAGRVGEARVHALLSRLFQQYRAGVLRDVTLVHPRTGMTAQIDHLLVVPSGIIVIETKQWGGTIVPGSQAQPWTQYCADGSVRIFHNPLEQNAWHVAVVQTCLQGVVPASAITGLVVFTTGQPLSGQWPAGVGDLAWLARVLTTSQRPSRLSPDTQRQCLAALHLQRLAPGRATDRRHRAAVRQRHGGEA